jgi:hypothetical protein
MFYKKIEVLGVSEKKRREKEGDAKRKRYMQGKRTAKEE